ncbi:non-homologous end joining protein Ku [Mycolicibacterium sphagni]|uniref:non-homologous end joining protein Ku n=1 Tax=Mycolicibacterium sphagni TaxID=1786 RepID=UPI0021F2A8FD|nr:Ku protein [Mycolicibacterium sphagni]MCV7174813.1 Ku protein [Mycolicibacterium sphagni]
MSSGMRSMKNTAINFGLVNVAVKMYKATSNHDVQFHQHHRDCHGAIGYTKVCKACGDTLDAAQIVKGITRDEGLITVSPEELDALTESAGTAVEVVQFIDADEIDPIAYESHYYCEPNKASLEGYVLLRDVMVTTGRVAVVKFVMRNDRTHLGIMRPVGAVLVVDSMAYPDEIRKPAFSILDTPIAINPVLMEAAKSIVDAMTGEFDPHALEDTFTNRLLELIEAKASGGEGVVPTAAVVDLTEGAGVVNDLLAKLEASAVKLNAAGEASARSRHPAGRKRAPAAEKPAATKLRSVPAAKAAAPAKKAAPAKAARRSKVAAG